MDTVKCPACGFETPEEQGFCDFCKEPFRKRPEPAPPPKEHPKVVVPPEVFAKLADARRQAAPAEAPAAGIPAEFAHLDTGGRIAAPSEVIRYLAWGFLALILFAGAVGMLWAVSRAKTDRHPARRRVVEAPPAVPPPAQPAPSQSDAAGEPDQAAPPAVGWR